MPNGEFSPLRNMLRVSATPSPSASRNSVMRLALGTPAPAHFCACLYDKALDALAVVRLRRRVAFGDQHVAVRQHIDRARMIEPGREGVDRHAVGGGRLGAVGPAVDGGDIDGRDPRMFRRRQGGRRTIALRRRSRCPAGRCRRQAAAPVRRRMLPGGCSCAWRVPRRCRLTNAVPARTFVDAA